MPDSPPSPHNPLALTDGNIHIQYVDDKVFPDDMGPLRQLRQQIAQHAAASGVKIDALRATRNPYDTPNFSMHEVEGKLVFGANPSVLMGCIDQSVDLEGVIHHEHGHAKNNNFIFLGKSGQVFDILDSLKILEKDLREKPRVTTALISNRFGSLNNFTDDVEAFRSNVFPFFEAVKKKYSVLFKAKPEHVSGATFARLIEAKDDSVLWLNEQARTGLPSPEAMTHFSARLGDLVKRTGRIAEQRIAPTEEQQKALTALRRIRQRAQHLGINDFFSNFRHGEEYASDRHAVEQSSNPRSMIQFLQKVDDVLKSIPADPNFQYDRNPRKAQMDTHPSDGLRIRRMESLIKTGKPPADHELDPVIELLESGIFTPQKKPPVQRKHTERLAQQQSGADSSKHRS